jgi:hypothetical protein
MLFLDLMLRMVNVGLFCTNLEVLICHNNTNDDWTIISKHYKRRTSPESGSLGEYLFQLLSSAASY